MKTKLVKVYGPPFDYRKQAWRDRPILIENLIRPDESFLKFYGRLQSIICAGVGITKQELENAPTRIPPKP